MLKTFLALRDLDRTQRPARTRKQRSITAILDMWKFCFRYGEEWEGMMIESLIKRLAKRGLW